MLCNINSQEKQARGKQNSKALGRTTGFVMCCCAEWRVPVKQPNFASFNVSVLRAFGQQYLPAHVSDTTVPHFLHLQFRDVKCQTQFPLSHCSVCVNKLGGLAICMYFHSLFLQFLLLYRNALEYILHQTKRPIFFGAAFPLFHQRKPLVVLW